MNINMNVHNITEITQQTVVYETFKCINMHIKQANGETFYLSLYDCPSIRPNGIKYTIAPDGVGGTQ
jgi:hypothetical protein